MFPLLILPYLKECRVAQLFCLFERKRVNVYQFLLISGDEVYVLQDHSSFRLDRLEVVLVPYLSPCPEGDGPCRRNSKYDRAGQRP